MGYNGFLLPHSYAGEGLGATRKRKLLNLIRTASSVSIYNHCTVDYRKDRNIRLLIKFLTFYLCITFHFIAIVIYIIRDKGVFNS